MVSCVFKCDVSHFQCESDITLLITRKRGTMPIRTMEHVVVYQVIIFKKNIFKKKSNLYFKIGANNMCDVSITAVSTYHSSSLS